MQPFSCDPPLTEAKIQNQLRDALRQDGWLVEKVHGGPYQAGWPDLFAFHRDHGHRWIEVKTPKGKLTDRQRARFAAWEAAGESIWVLSGVQDLSLLNGPQNWREWL